MMSSFVSAAHYRDFQGGWGTSTPDEIAELRKALYAGDSVNDPGVSPGQGFPLRTESLEATLKNLTFEMDEVKLFKSIPKVPAFNTVEEYNRLLSYSNGGARQFDLGFMAEGDLPEEQDSTYQRMTVLMKFLGAVGRVTHVASVIRPAHGNVVAMETMNKTMYLLQQIENALFFGDASMVPEQFDGLYRLISTGAPDNELDLRGQPITEEFLNDVLLRIRDNFGTGTDFYSATGPFGDLSKQVLDRQRFAVAPAPGVIGATVNAFQGQHGRINLHDSVFIQPGQAAVAGGVGLAAKRPMAPTVLAGPTAAANPLSLFGAGTYIYQIVAASRYGRSTPVTTAAVVVAAGDGVSITVQDNGPGTTYYEVYRTTPGGAVGTAKLMAKVARTGASQIIVDLNADIPGTSKAFCLMQNQRSFSWAQLLPMTRIPLATIDTSIRWAQVIYGGVKLYTPGKNVVIKNVGRMPGSIP